MLGVYTLYMYVFAKVDNIFFSKLNCSTFWIKIFGKGEV